ncbi:MAG: alpha/beta fold hydrolase [Desulfobulbaceae bacterium]|nr:alpha/beta fold hydrolase [Desulfobulbaceae bacterium]
MSKIILDKFSLSYKCIGKGRDIVLIHGLAANSGFWSPNLLMPLARQYRVTLFDLRGHGKSNMPATGYTSADMAKDFLSLLDYLNIQDADVIGHSFGGVVALHGAILSPKRIRSLVLADTRLRTFEPTLTARDLCRNEKFSRKLAILGIKLPENENETGLWLLEQMASPEWRDKRELLRKMQGFPPFAGANANGSIRTAERWLELLRTTTARQDFTKPAGLSIDKIRRLRQPILVICGENSTAIRTMTGLRKHLANCIPHIMEDAGHFFPMTHPAKFLGVVQKFLLDVREGERRGHTRLPLSLRMDALVGQLQSFAVTTLDVSESGLLISGGENLNLGMNIDLYVDIDTAEKIQLLGKVVRLSPVANLHNFFYGIELTRNGKGQKFWEDYLAQMQPFLRRPVDLQGHGI